MKLEPPQTMETEIFFIYNVCFSGRYAYTVIKKLRLLISLSAHNSIFWVSIGYIRFREKFYF